MNSNKSLTISKEYLTPTEDFDKFGYCNFAPKQGVHHPVAYHLQSRAGCVTQLSSGKLKYLDHPLCQLNRDRISRTSAIYYVDKPGDLE